MKIKKLLITSVGTTTAINLIKYFKASSDWFIVGTDINEMGYTAGSQLVDYYYKVPFACEDAYIPELIKIIKDMKVEYIIPIHDSEIEAIASYGVIRLGCDCIIPDLEVITLLRDKEFCNRSVAQLGIHVPANVIPTEHVRKICRDKTSVGSKGIEIFESDNIVPNYNPSTQVIQEYITGDEYTVDVLCDREGRLIYAVPRLRMEVKSGVATKVKIIQDHKMIAIVKNIYKAIRIPGLSNIQFIKDQAENIWFIEINGRFSGCGAATVLACKKFMDTFVKILKQKEITQDLNEDVMWNSIVTRYYNEILYKF